MKRCSSFVIAILYIIIFTSSIVALLIVLPSLVNKTRKMSSQIPSKSPARTPTSKEEQLGVIFGSPLDSFDPKSMPKIANFHMVFEVGHVLAAKFEMHRHSTN